MRRLAFVTALTLAMAAGAEAQTQTQTPTQRACADGAECGVLDRLGELFGRLDPWFADLAEMLGDLSGWHAPEVLPNGDILIRRRQPAGDDAPAPLTDPLEL